MTTHCSRHVKPRQTDIPTQSNMTRATVTQASATSQDIITVSALTTLGTASNAITDAIDSFSSRMAAELAVQHILSTTTLLSQAAVSNTLAGIAAEDITRVLVNTHYAREKLIPNSLNYMQMYEEVLRRGTPPWTCLLALDALLDYYCYHHTTSRELHEKYIALRTLAAQLTPEDASDPASLRTFASIQVGLLQRLDDEDVLKRLDYIEQLARDKRAPFDDDVLESLPIPRAIALIKLNRAKEARAIIQGMHDRIDSLKDSYTKQEVRDVQNFMDRVMSTRWDLYPEYKNKTY